MIPRYLMSVIDVALPRKEDWTNRFLTSVHLKLLLVRSWMRPICPFLISHCQNQCRQITVTVLARVKKLRTWINRPISLTPIMKPHQKSESSVPWTHWMSCSITYWTARVQSAFWTQRTVHLCVDSELWRKFEREPGK